MRKRLFLIILSLVLAVSGVSCNATDKSEQTNVQPTVSFWTPYSTEKIMRDVTYSNRQDAPVLKYEMAKNEVEGAQFIITPKNDYKVKSFNVQVSDLICGDNVISKNNLSVYLEKYVRQRHRRGRPFLLRAAPRQS